MGGNKLTTMGCCSADELCPASHKAEKYDWPIGDPLGRPWEVMQSVRDDIEERVKKLLEDIKGGRK